MHVSLSPRGTGGAYVLEVRGRRANRAKGAFPHRAGDGVVQHDTWVIGGRFFLLSLCFVVLLPDLSVLAEGKGGR